MGEVLQYLSYSNLKYTLTIRGSELDDGTTTSHKLTIELLSKARERLMINSQLPNSPRSVLKQKEAVYSK